MRKALTTAFALLAVTAHAAPPAVANLNAANPPNSRSGPLGAINPAAAETVYIFGGSLLGAINNQLWTYDVTQNSWTEVTDSNPPGVRAWGAMNFDPKQKRLILFGGATGINGPLLNDVWSFDPATNAWTQLTSTDTPTPRFLHSMVYLPHLGKHLVFGGATGLSNSSKPTSVDNGLYLLTVNANAGTASWEHLAPQGRIAPRSAVCSGYDPASKRFYVYGGEVVDDTLGDTAYYDLVANTWVEALPASAGPSKRGSTSCAFDERSGKLVMVGGVSASNGNPLGDLYSYDPVNNSWALLNPPTGTGNVTLGFAGYSAQLGGVFLFGGRTSTLGTSRQAYSIRTNVPPVVRIESVNEVDEQGSVNLSAAGSQDLDGDALTYEWLQRAGPVVTVSQVSGPLFSFVAPSVNEPKQLRFSVTVSDGVDTRTSELSVLVRNSDSTPVVPGPEVDAGTPSRPGTNPVPGVNPDELPSRMILRVGCSAASGAFVPLLLLGLLGLARRRQR